MKKDMPSYKGKISQRPIVINNDETNVLILRCVSPQDMLDLIKRYEAARIEDYWEDVLLRQSYQGKYIQALNNCRLNGISVNYYFTPSCMDEMVNPLKSGHKRDEALRKLSLKAQKETVRQLMPKTRAELKKILRLPITKTVIAPDFYEIYEKQGTTENFINHLVDGLRKNSTPPFHLDRYMEFLTMLWGSGIFLFPQDMRNWTCRTKVTTFLNERFSGNRIKQVKEGQAFLGHHRGASNTLFYQFFASADITSTADISHELLDSFEDFRFSVIEKYAKDISKDLYYNHRAYVTRVTHTLTVLFNAAFPESAIERARVKVGGQDKENLRGSASFRWLVQANPDLAEWANALRDYVSKLKTATIAGPVERLNFLGDYLCSLHNPPMSPLELIREVHIYDPTGLNENTYFDFLRQNASNVTRLNAILRAARYFFDGYADALIASRNPHRKIFRNPILETDSFGKDTSRKRGTPRDALPSFIINTMKEILTENDFAFGRAHRQEGKTKVVDRKTGRPAFVWYPGLTVCMYIMLETPLRNHQARWLDSGLLDDLVYDFESNSEIPNLAKEAISGRREGVFCLQSDLVRSTAWLGLRVNTNKSASIDSKEPGYVIPYISERCTSLIRMMIDWQHRYMPPPKKPIPYFAFKEEQEGQKIRDFIVDKGPQVVPLFRDPNARNKDGPITYNKLVTFYTHLLLETQERVRIKYGRKVKLATIDEDGLPQWEVDLHTLRVSGITFMIENGVPLEVVAQYFSGHATIVMSLHYLKFAPHKLRDFIADAHDRALAEEDFVGSEWFAENLDEYAEFLLGQSGAGTGAGFEALKEKSGIFTITTDGICPGTSCGSGGPVDSTKIKHGPVPGGRRCGLCRYWITGPAFLLGQVAAVNNLAYAIRKKGLEIAELNDRRLEAEDTGDQRLARELADRVSKLNLEISLDLQEWSSRYNFAAQSATLLDKYIAKRTSDGNEAPVPMLTADSSDALKVTLESAHEFVLLDHITQMSAFVTGFKNREAEMEKNLILTKMMDANGIKPFLLRLDDEQAKEAGNLLSSLIIQQVRGQELDDVLAGKVPIKEYPKIERAIKVIQEETELASVSHTADWHKGACQDFCVKRGHEIIPKGMFHDRRNDYQKT